MGLGPVLKGLLQFGKMQCVRNLRSARITRSCAAFISKDIQPGPHKSIWSKQDTSIRHNPSITTLRWMTQVLSLEESGRGKAGIISLSSYQEPKNDTIKTIVGITHVPPEQSQRAQGQRILCRRGN